LDYYRWKPDNPKWYNCLSVRLWTLVFADLCPGIVKTIETIGLFFQCDIPFQERRVPDGTSIPMNSTGKTHWPSLGMLLLSGGGSFLAFGSAVGFAVAG
jgi:hypothetical protein